MKGIKMTEEEILAMKPGIELDALTHKEIFGKKVLRIGDKNFPRASKDKEHRGIFRCVSCGEEAPVATTGFDVDGLTSICFNFCSGRRGKILRMIKGLVQILPYYSTGIPDAWQVLEELIKLGFYPDIDYLRKDYGQGRWRCIVRTDIPRIHFLDVRKKAPEAICKVALLATLGRKQ